MVTKWKNKSKKICERRRGYIFLWAAVLFFMILFFAGLGVMVRDVGTLRDIPAFFLEREYIDSEMHREEVVAAFDEVQKKAVLPKTEDVPWEFQGMYDLLIQHGDYFFFHQSNIPDAEYEKYIKAQKEEASEEEYHIQESRELAEWYFNQNMDCYYIWNKGVFKTGGNENEEMREELNLTQKDTCIAVGFTAKQLEEGQNILDRIHRHVVYGCSMMAVGFLASLFFFFTLVLGRGMDFACRLDSDVSVIIFVACLFTDIHFTQMFFDENVGGENMAGHVIPKAGILGVVSVLAVCAVYIIICNLRAGRGVEGFWFIRLWGSFRSKITGECYYGEGIQVCSKKRQKFTFRLLVVPLGVTCSGLGLYALSGFRWYSVSADVFMGICLVEMLMIPYLFGVCVVIHLYQKGTERILKDEYVRLMEQMDELSEGNYQSGRLLGEGSVFSRESWKMSMLGCQMQENVEKKIQAEKMKIDLITNVSHDLKTPLTSIISYIDLLSKEDLSPAAGDYIQILEKKSERLRKMIADVFDLSKASSGSLKIRREKLDFNKLLIQILADMGQEIKEAPVKVVQEISENAGIIKSDGEKLYRVLQNILDNALRYSMPETRIYVTLKVENRRVSVCVKNVSAYEMNFTREEVLGRFFRGDKSRSTEGSGLGLAIAREFTEVCGGKLDLRIDGDVFAVKVEFPCCDVIAG